MVSETNLKPSCSNISPVKHMGKYQTISQGEDSETLAPNVFLSKRLPVYMITILVCLLSAALFFSFESKQGCGSVEVYQTTSDGVHSLSKMPDDFVTCSSNHLLRASLGPSADIQISRSQTRQSIIGFGGAFTEAASLNFASLPASVQQRVLQLYWGKDGAGYTLGRVPIGSCDFSMSSYSFDDTPGDWDLKYFDMQVTHDQEAMIPFIKQAVAMAASSGKPIKLFGSPWSPPAWLKAKVKGVQSMDGSSQKGGLLDSDQARHTWASYLSKWITAYQFQGFDIWGLTVQNEPEFAAPWEACKYNATKEASFIREHLGPILKEEHPGVKLMAFDHNKDHLESWTSAMFATDGSGAADYVDGMAFHWYAGGMDRLQDGIFGHHFVAKTHEILKDATTARVEQFGESQPSPFLLSTEACSCSGTATPGSRLSWIRSERYAHDILNDLANYANGWVDWNLLLDFQGGPNHLGNVCDAPILTNPDFSGITVQPYLNTIAHFSKYLVPGTTMVDTTLNTFYKTSPPLSSDSSDVSSYGGATRMPSGATLALWPCDGSSRQRVLLNPDTQKLVVENVQRLGDVGLEESPEALLTLCVGNVNNAVGGNSAQVVDCDADEWVGRFTYEKAENGNKLKLLNPLDDEVSQSSGSGTCLGAPLRYTSLMKGGAPLTLAPCEDGNDKKNGLFDQNWHWNKELKSYEIMNGDAFEDVVNSKGGANADSKKQCLTIGWPFVQAVAGVTPSDETVVVVVNEGNLPVSVSISFDDAASRIEGHIPPQSIQTYAINAAK